MRLGKIVLGYDGEPGKGKWVVAPAIVHQKPKGRRRSSRDGIYCTPGGVR